MSPQTIGDELPRPGPWFSRPRCRRPCIDELPLGGPCPDRGPAPRDQDFRAFADDSTIRTLRMRRAPVGKRLRR